jgi:hypothetical protein
MPKIFISYRREDSAYPAHQIYREIVDHFGPESVVFDVDTIPFGTDFREYLNEEVSNCDILLAIIGDQWLEILNKRLDEANDFIRIEIQTALERQIPVIPVLVGNALVPKEKSLPPELAELAYRQATEVRSGINLGSHLNRLIVRLDTLKPVSETGKIKKIPRYLLTLIAVFLVFFLIIIGSLIFPKIQKMILPDLLFEDKFDNSKYEGSLNHDKWYVDPENNSSKMSNVQENGLLHSTLKPIELYDNEISSREQWKLDQIKSVEWRLKIQNAVRGEWASLAVGLKTKNEHRLTCDFIVNGENPLMKCFCWKDGNEDVYAENIPIHLDTWHTLRLDIENEPLSFSFYLDEEKKGSSPVKDIKPWKDNYVKIYSDLGATNSQDTLISYIDHVAIIKR